MYNMYKCLYAEYTKYMYTNPECKNNRFINYFCSHMRKFSYELLHYCLCCLYRSFRAISVDPMVDPVSTLGGDAEGTHANLSSADATRSSVGPDGTVYTTRRQQMRCTSVQRSGGTTSRTVPRLPPSGKPNLILSYGRSKEDLACKFHDFSSSLLMDTYGGITSPYLDATGYSTRSVDSVTTIHQRRRLSHF